MNMFLKEKQLIFDTSFSHSTVERSCCISLITTHVEWPRSFTALYGKKRRLYTMAVNDHRIRRKTERNAIRIRRSYKNTENRRKFSVPSGYGVIRCEYFVINYRARIFHSRKSHALTQPWLVVSLWSQNGWWCHQSTRIADAAIRIPESHVFTQPWRKSLIKVSVIVPQINMVFSSSCCCSHYTDETAKETVVLLSVISEKTKEREKERKI